MLTYLRIFLLFFIIFLSVIGNMMGELQAFLGKRNNQDAEEKESEQVCFCEFDFYVLRESIEWIENGRYT